MAANTQQEPTDLGKDVERAIEEFWLNCQQHGDPKKLSMIDCAPCRIAKNILESAIRARIDERAEPTKAAEPDPARLPHECWCKESADGHSQCFKVGRHRCGCGATRPYRYEGMPGYDVRYDFWSGGLSGKPDARAPMVAKIEDNLTADCKPQHIFERRHGHSPIRVEKGETLEAALRRTSEHNLSWLMDTSPANLLQLERLSNTVYVLLGHRDPEKLAAWINRAHDIANRAARL